MGVSIHMNGETDSGNISPGWNKQMATLLSAMDTEYVQIGDPYDGEGESIYTADHLAALKIARDTYSENEYPAWHAAFNRIIAQIVQHGRVHIQQCW